MCGSFQPRRFASLVSPAFWQGRVRYNGPRATTYRCRRTWSESSPPPTTHLLSYDPHVLPSRLLKRTSSYTDLLYRWQVLAGDLLPSQTRRPCRQGRGGARAGCSSRQSTQERCKTEGQQGREPSVNNSAQRELPAHSPLTSYRVIHIVDCSRIGLESNTAMVGKNVSHTTTKLRGGGERAHESGSGRRGGGRTLVHAYRLCRRLALLLVTKSPGDGRVQSHDKLRCPLPKLHRVGRGREDHIVRWREGTGLEVGRFHSRNRLNTQGSPYRIDQPQTSAVYLRYPCARRRQ